MLLDMGHLEVGGTLDNPAVLAAVAVWTAVLAGFTWLVVGWIHAPEGNRLAGHPWKRRLGYSVLAVAFASTVITQELLAGAFYRMVSEVGEFWSVGFWGGPPLTPSWVVSVVIGFISWRRQVAHVPRLAEAQK
jgi:hypothetical protein